MDYSKIREFYNALQDEESKYIFDMRVRYLFTGQDKFMREMVEDSNRLFHPPKMIRNVHYLLEHPEKCPKSLIIYGAGRESKRCLELLQNAKHFEVLAFCDREYQRWQQGGHLGYPVISPEQLWHDAEYHKCAVVISTACPMLCREISNSLGYYGRSMDQVFLMHGQLKDTNYIHRDSYFNQEFFEPVDNEVYIDAGCLDGYSIKQFVDFCSGHYSKIIGFEPHPDNYAKTIKNIKDFGLPNIEVIPKGVWSTEGEFSFELTGWDGQTAGAGVREHGEVTVATTSIDKTAGDSRVTFIKMDIEGAELQALQGAKDTILRWKPRLAICLYHKLEDVIEIPEFLYSLAPDYKFYIRHHNFIRYNKYANVDISSFYDTVLYAL